MGEAKRRGSKDERIAAAMGLRKMTIDEMRKEHGLPDDAEYLGYAVHLEKQDEFLAEFRDDEIATAKVWAKTPELAHTFESISDAVEVSRKCPGSIVVVMFDIGSQIVVLGITGIRAVS